MNVGERPAGRADRAGARAPRLARRRHLRPAAVARSTCTACRCAGRPRRLTAGPWFALDAGLPARRPGRVPGRPAARRRPRAAAAAARGRRRRRRAPEQVSCLAGPVLGWSVAGRRGLLPRARRAGAGRRRPVAGRAPVGRRRGRRRPRRVRGPRRRRGRTSCTATPARSWRSPTAATLATCRRRRADRGRRASASPPCDRDDRRRRRLRARAGPPAATPDAPRRRLGAPRARHAARCRGARDRRHPHLAAVAAPAPVRAARRRCSRSTAARPGTGRRPSSSGCSAWWRPATAWRCPTSAARTASATTASTRCAATGATSTRPTATRSATTWWRRGAGRSGAARLLRPLVRRLPRQLAGRHVAAVRGGGIGVRRRQQRLRLRPVRLRRDLQPRRRPRRDAHAGGRRAALAPVADRGTWPPSARRC